MGKNHRKGKRERSSKARRCDDSSDDKIPDGYKYADMDSFRTGIRNGIADYSRNYTLDADEELHDLLIVQSMEGRVSSGHVRGFKNAEDVSIEEIVRALGMSPEDTKRSRERIIDLIEEKVMTALDGTRGKLTLADGAGRPIAGLYALKDVTIQDPLMFAWGFYLGGGGMDCAERRLAMSGWAKGALGKDLPVHTGQCFPVDLERLLEQGCTSGEDLTLRRLAERNWSAEDIARLKEKGVIVSANPAEASRSMVNAYVQQSSGYGGSDDACFIYAALVYGMDAAWGLYLADLVDTLDKYVQKLYQGGRDQTVADKAAAHPAFQREFGPSGRDWLNDEVLNRFLLFGNTVPLNEIWDDESAPDKVSTQKVPSSSQAWFNRYQDNCSDDDDAATTLQAHLRFIETGEEPLGISIGYEQVPATTFYEALRQRIEFFRQKGLFPEMAKGAPLSSNGAILKYTP